MAEPEHKELRNSLENMLENVDREVIRPKQKKAYLCMASCFDQEYANSKDIQRCVQSCATSLDQSQHVLQEQVTAFQNRVQRSLVDCQDEAKDMILPGAKQDDECVKSAETHMRKCTVGKFRQYIQMVSGLEKRILSSLKTESE